MKIYVGNISREASEQDVKNLFEEYGDVSSVKLIRDNATKVLKGFGFVEMSNDAEAEAAIETLNGKNFKERPLTVSVAKPKTENHKGGFKPRGNRPYDGNSNRGQNYNR